jgi:hypothetical protein
MKDDFSRQLAEVGITAQSFSAFDDADQARLRQILSHPLERQFLAQLITAPSFSLPLFLRQSDELQATMIFRANNMVLLMNHVMPFDKLLAMEESLRDEFIEWGREVKKLVHDYRVPLADLLKLDPEQRSDLIGNANYFTEILKAAENQRTVQQLLEIANMNLTETGVMRQLNTAVEELRGDTRNLFRGLKIVLPPEIILHMVVGLRNTTLIGPQHARDIVENTDLNAAPQNPPHSPRGGKK